MEGSVTNVHRLKVILLGDGGVGKTSLIDRYVKGTFQRKPLDFREPLSKRIEVKGKHVELQIHDTGGKERQGDRGLEAAFFNNAKACMLVYDVNDPKSLENLENWHNEFRNKLISNHSSLEGFPFVVLGNKADTNGGREVYPEQAMRWCQEKNIQHFLTSARDNRRVAEAFAHVAECALNYEAKLPNQPSTVSRPSPNPPNAPYPPPSPPRKRCCTIL